MVLSTVLDLSRPVSGRGWAFTPIPPGTPQEGVTVEPGVIRLVTGKRIVVPESTLAAIGDRVSARELPGFGCEARYVLSCPTLHATV